MAFKGIGSGKSGGRGKGKQGGPRQPAGRKEGKAGASRSFGGDRDRYKPQSNEKRGPVSGPRKDKPVVRHETRPPMTRKAPAREAPARVVPVMEDLHTGMEEKVMGINPVMELLKSGSRPVDALFIDSDKGGKQFEELIALARRAGVKVKVVPGESLDKLSGGIRHQGVLATVAAKEYADFQDLVSRILEKSGVPLLLILDGIEDPQNLGSIIRTAESAGVDGVVIPEHRAAHLTAAVARASAGALEHMPVAKVTNLVDAMNYLKEKGFWIIGLEGGAKAGYTGFDMKIPLAVILGGEGSGIRPVVMKNCDALVSLPMMGKVNSLNVSVAAGVVLYEALRQRAALKNK